MQKGTEANTHTDALASAVIRNGLELHGDNFDAERINRWYEEESSYGYVDLVRQTNKDYSYGYHALNDYHAWKGLRSRQYGTCLALGCATGADVSPLAHLVDRYVAIEPAEKWWSAEIGGRPAEYIAPSPLGTIPLEDGSTDLAVALGVLHHVPNVSYVLREISRVLSPDGLIVIREPIHSMGDWSRERRGLTKNERGLPLPWLRETLKSVGLSIVQERLCLFPAIPRIARTFGLRHAYNSHVLTRLDALCSMITGWNLHYHRDSLWKKIAPRDVFLIARKVNPLAPG